MYQTVSGSKTHFCGLFYPKLMYTNIINQWPVEIPNISDVLFMEKEGFSMWELVLITVSQDKDHHSTLSSDKRV